MKHNNTITELENKLAETRQALDKAYEEEAAQKYGHLNGAWIKFIDVDYRLDDNEYEQEMPDAKVHYIHVQKVTQITPLGCNVDRITIAPIAGFALEDSNFCGTSSIKSYDNPDDYDFRDYVYSNRISIITQAEAEIALNDSVKSYQSRVNTILKQFTR